MPNESRHSIGGRTALGYWRGSDDSDLPDPRASVDPSWDPAERALVVAYLRAAPRLEQWRGYSWCRICDLSTNGTGCLGDDTYNWPEGFAHYVEAHGVRPPAGFVAHVLSRGVSPEWPVRRNLEQLYNECRYLSGGFDRNPLFWEVAAFGDKVVPLLLADLAKGPEDLSAHPWVVLRLLYSVVRKEDQPEFDPALAGQIAPLRETWLAWGRERCLIA